MWLTELLPVSATKMRMSRVLYPLSVILRRKFGIFILIMQIFFVLMFVFRIYRVIMTMKRIFFMLNFCNIIMFLRKISLFLTNIVYNFEP